MSGRARRCATSPAATPCTVTSVRRGSTSSPSHVYMVSGESGASRLPSSSRKVDAGRSNDIAPSATCTVSLDAAL